MFNSHKTGAFVYLTNIYMFLSPLQSMAQFLLKPCATPVMHGRSFIYALQGARLALLALLHSIQCQSKKHSSQIQALELLTARTMFLQHQVSWCAEPSSFFPLPFWQWERSGKQGKLCDLKSCRVKCLHNEDAGCSRMLTPFLGGEHREWFPGCRLTGPSGLI